MTYIALQLGVISDEDIIQTHKICHKLLENVTVISGIEFSDFCL